MVQLLQVLVLAALSRSARSWNPDSDASTGKTDSLLQAASLLEDPHSAASRHKTDDSLEAERSAAGTKVKAVATIDNMAAAPANLKRKDWRPDVKEAVDPDLDWHYSPIRIYENLLMQSRKNCRMRLDVLASDLGTSSPTWLQHSDCHTDYCNSWFWTRCVQDRSGATKQYMTWDDARQCVSDASDAFHNRLCADSTCPTVGGAVVLFSKFAISSTATVVAAIAPPLALGGGLVAAAAKAAIDVVYAMATKELPACNGRRGKDGSKKCTNQKKAALMNVSTEVLLDTMKGMGKNKYLKYQGDALEAAAEAVAKMALTGVGDTVGFAADSVEKVLEARSFAADTRENAEKMVALLEEVMKMQNQVMEEADESKNWWFTSSLTPEIHFTTHPPDDHKCAM